MELVDPENYQLLAAGRQFTFATAASPRIAGNGHYSFITPATNTYYIVVDNRANLFQRDYKLRVDENDGTQTERERKLRELYTGRYSGLKKMFRFRDFDIAFRSCGVANAFSNPNITICSELVDDLEDKGISDVELWVFFHEIAHTLLRTWDSQFRQ